jgi:PIN domain nuclease of toxin-antitoxin system
LIAYLDTHVFVYLAENNTRRLTLDAQRLIDKADLLISPIVLLELEVLHEVGRVNLPRHDIHRKLEHEIGLRVCTLPFTHVAEVARDEAWTRDPFDRIIVAQAKANQFAYLISADETIAKHYPRTVW